MDPVSENPEAGQNTGRNPYEYWLQEVLVSQRKFGQLVLDPTKEMQGDRRR